MNARGAVACAVSAALLCAPAVVAAADPHAAHRAAAQAAGGASPTRVALPGSRLAMRDGSALVLDAAAFDDRIVVVGFVFTHCTTICPALTAIMTGVQRGLRDDGNDDWRLVSISVDPARDTPARLDAYARSVGAGDDWWWLTGSAPEVDRTLAAFGIAPGAPEAHPPVLLVGRPARGEWRRWVGLPAPAQVLAAVRTLREDARRHGDPHARHP